MMDQATYTKFQNQMTMHPIAQNQPGMKIMAHQRHHHCRIWSLIPLIIRLIITVSNKGLTAFLWQLEANTTDIWLRQVWTLLWRLYTSSVTWKIETYKGHDRKFLSTKKKKKHFCEQHFWDFLPVIFWSYFPFHLIDKHRKKACLNCYVQCFYKSSNRIFHCAPRSISFHLFILVMFSRKLNKMSSSVEDNRETSANKYLIL